MIITNFNEKPHFSFTYGDEVENNNKKLSNYLVNKLKEKWLQNCIRSVAIALLTLNSPSRTCRIR